jgi:hypothetical protein
MIRGFGKAIWALLTNEWCRHEWETVEEFYLWKDDFWKTEHLTHEKVKPEGSFVCKGKVYHQRCYLCRDIRQERIEI